MADPPSSEIKAQLEADCERIAAAASEEVAIATDVPEDTSLLQKVQALQKQLEHEMFGNPDDERVSSETLLKQLKSLCKDRDQFVDGLQTTLEEKEKNVTQLQEELNRRQEEQVFSWEAGDLADLLSTQSEAINDSSPEYSGIPVQDLVWFRDRIIENMEAYCRAHKQNAADLSHVSLETPCRFAHFHIPWAADGDTEISEGRKLQDLQPNMYLVLERYVKTCLCGSKSFVQLMNKVKERSPLKVTTFVSHSWSEPFREFIDTLSCALDQTEAVYVSGFAMDLSVDDEHLTYDVVNSWFVRALKASQKLLVVMDAHASTPKRLWCDFEVVLARSIRKPIMMWPHASWNGKLAKLQGKIRKLDVLQSRCTDKEDERKLKTFILTNGGDIATCNRFIQGLLLDRVNFFAKACQQASSEAGCKGSGKLSKARVRDILTRLEVEDVRQITFQDVQHGDYEFAEVTGPFFPASDAVEPCYDSTLGSGYLVSRCRGSNGLNRLKCVGNFDLGFGTWKVGFIMRRVLPVQGCRLRKEYYFHEEVALSLNGMIEKCTTLSAELGTEWQMVEAGEVTIPSPGLGLITQEIYTGTLSHKSINKGKTVEVSMTLMWSLGRKELYKGSWTLLGKTQAIRYEEDGVYLSFMDDASGSGLCGRWVETDDDRIVLRGEVEQNGLLDGEFELTMSEEQLRCTVEVMMTGNEGGAQQQGLMYSSNAFGKKSGGITLPALGVPPQLGASYQSKPKCMSKTCECTTRPLTDYGLFIDRCYAFRQSPWIPQEQALPQRSIRAEPGFRIT